MSKPIFIATHPNFEKDDIDIVSKNLFTLPNETDENIIENFQELVSKYFKRQAFAVDSARSSFYLLLKSLNFPDESEVILPAFSCMVIANAVKWAGLKPVFVDCNVNDYNYDLEDLKNKKSTNSKLILVQHTFGFPENIDKLRKVLGDEIFIVEDLAHSLGGSFKDRKLGTFGDAAIMTFGIEKVISSLRGGMLLVKDEALALKVRDIIKNLEPFPRKITFVSLLGVILWKVFTPIYYLGIGRFTLGRILVYIAHKLGLMGNMIESCEYDTCQPKWLPAKMSPTLALLGINQFNKIERLNGHRKKISDIYQTELGVRHQQEVGTEHVFLRFPLCLDRRDELLHEAKRNQIVLGDWYKNILYAPKTTLDLLGYIQGSCPNAEFLAKRIINLPTYINISTDDALRISNLVKKYL